jgi:hypothetical protein
VSRVIIGVSVLVIAVAMLALALPASHPLTVLIYDSDPSHIWNRLYAALFVRQDAGGEIFGADSLDPAPVMLSRHLLEKKSHRNAIRVLDEFLRTHAETLIPYPLRRVVLARDLWAVFDWSVERRPVNGGDPTYDEEKKELQVRLAEILRRLALTPQEIEALPDNYAEAIASGRFPKDYDPTHPARAFLPPDLFDPHGPWVLIQGTDKPPAEQHVSFFSGRSRFLIFIRLPEGRKATFDYLRQLWEYPQPWVKRNSAVEQTELNPLLPSFPAGTQVALVRQMTVFDDQGNLRAAPITESVQIHVYRSVTAVNPPPAGTTTAIAISGQQFYEIRLDRGLLFAGLQGGLREITRDEKELFLFNGVAVDELDDPKAAVDWSRVPPILERCAMCHSGPGIQSLNSRAALLKPHPMPHDAGNRLEQEGTLSWKKNRDDWTMLNEYWKLMAARQ